MPDTAHKAFYRHANPKPIQEDEVMSPADKQFAVLVPKLQKMLRTKNMTMPMTIAVLELFAKAVDGTSQKKLNLPKLAKISLYIDRMVGAQETPVGTTGESEERGPASLTEAMKIDTKVQMKTLAKKLGVRPDWHEPDEQNVTAKVTGKQFDNAGFETELALHIYQDKTEVAEVNLATLCSLASGYSGEVSEELDRRVSLIQKKQ